MQDCDPAADVPDPSDPDDPSILGTNEHYLDCRVRVNAFFHGHPDLDAGFAEYNTVFVYQTEIASRQRLADVGQLNTPQSAYLAGLRIAEYISQAQSKHNKGRWRDRGKRGVGRGGVGRGWKECGGPYC